MEEIRLTAEKRDGAGKGGARKLRAKGFIPAVLYGPEIDPASVSVNTREITTLLRKTSAANKLIDLSIDGEDNDRKVIIRELQRDPVTGIFKHLDLYQVSMTKKLNITVRVNLTGTPAGVKLGGILQHIVRDMEIACLPLDIPDKIEIDVSELEIGDSIHVSDISFDKVDIMIAQQRTIATVVPPTVVKTAAEEAAEAAEAEEGEELLAEGEEAVEGEAKPEGEGEAEAKKEEPKEDKKDKKGKK
jgi:large subunit ribosomal protein L25